MHEGRPPGGRRPGFRNDVDEFDLDRQVWLPHKLPHHLPAWSSRAATAATYEVRDSCLQLSPPVGRWWPRGWSGLEDFPERCAEICVFELFGDAVEPGTSAAVGMGLHAFRDPDAPEEFAAVRLPVDMAEFHIYAVDRTAERVEFSVDGTVVRSCSRPPTYPMQLMVAAFDFTDRSTGADDDAVPRLVVDHVIGIEY